MLCSLSMSSSLTGSSQMDANQLARWMSRSLTGSSQMDANQLEHIKPNGSMQLERVKPDGCYATRRVKPDGCHANWACQTRWMPCGLSVSSQMDAFLLQLFQYCLHHFLLASTGIHRHTCRVLHSQIRLVQPAIYQCQFANVYVAPFQCLHPDRQTDPLPPSP